MQIVTQITISFELAKRCGFVVKKLISKRYKITKIYDLHTRDMLPMCVGVEHANALAGW